MAENENVSKEPAASGSLVSRLVVVGFMGAIVMGECAMAYLWLPDADSILEKAKQKVAEEIESEQSDDDEQPVDTKPTSEVELGSFGVTSLQPASGTTLRVDFVLVGTVLDSDRNNFDELLARNQHRFRDLIILEIRNTDTSDLTDPGLGLIKRRILEKSNQLFGQPILRSIVFSDYTYLDQ